MKTSAIEVHDMLSVFSVVEVEKRIGEVPGVQSVTVNFAVGNATVRYDETQLEATDIKSAVRQRGFDPAAPVAGPLGTGWVECQVFLCSGRGAGGRDGALTLLRCRLVLRVIARGSGRGGGIGRRRRCACGR